MNTAKNYNPEFDFDSPYMDKYKYKMSKCKLDGDTDRKKIRRTRFKSVNH